MIIRNASHVFNLSVILQNYMQAISLTCIEVSYNIHARLRPGRLPQHKVCMHQFHTVSVCNLARL